MRRNYSFAGNIAFIWGVGGIAMLLAFALYRLVPHALAALAYEWTWWQWMGVAVWCLFMVMSEGYDGFQKRLIPRIYMRAHALRRSGRPLHRILAPAYCLNYLSAEKRRMIIAYVALSLIVAAVYVVHGLDQPLRGMIDWGVVAGLTYGIVALLLRMPQYCQLQKTEL